MWACWCFYLRSYIFYVHPSSLLDWASISSPPGDGCVCVCVCMYVRLWRRLGENPSSGSVSADTHFSFLCFPFEKRERKNFRWARSRRALNWPSRNFCEPTAPHNMRTHNTKFKKKISFPFRPFIFLLFDGRANDLSREKEKQIESVKEDRKSHTV